jgi:Flp pilus assembly CpaE family ATPase
VTRRGGARAIGLTAATGRQVSTPARLRLDQARALIAISDPQRERVVLEALGSALEDGITFQVVRRCLDTHDLLASIPEADVGIVSPDLHGLGAEALRGLAYTRVPVLLWATGDTPSIERLPGSTLTVLSRDVGADDIRAALESILRTDGRGRSPSQPLRSQRSQLEVELLRAAGLPVALDNQPAPATGIILALIGPPGGHGVSTAAAGLTAGLDRMASVALVDMDLRHPSQALALDLNPARNLCMVLHEAGVADDADLWSGLLEAELQPLDPACTRAVVLAGPPTASLGRSVSSDQARKVLRNLARHERFVVADLGSELDAGDELASVQRAALEVADRVLIVARSDVVGLRRAAATLENIRAVVDRPDERLALILNRHQERHHHGAVEVARSLQTTVAAVIPEDPSRVQAALAAQRPLVASGGARRGSAARALVAFARSIEAAGPGALARTGDETSRRWIWSRRLRLPRLPRRRA